MNTTNWTIWLALSMTYCALTYNPLYQALLLAAICSASLTHRKRLTSFIKTGIAVSAIPLFVNLFFVHMGQTTLYTVPHKADLMGLKIPTLFFAGPITAESAAMGVIMTVFITNMMAAFQTFTASAKPEAILALMPKSMPALGLSTAVALRFVPAVLRDHSSIRDAQVSRGVRLVSGSIRERLGNRLTIVAPTVITALERGFNLSESMASRGYAGHRSTYAQEDWSPRERMVAAALVFGLALTLIAGYLGLLSYWPYDGIALPAPSPAAILPLAIISLPAMLKK